MLPTDEPISHTQVAADALEHKPGSADAAAALSAVIAYVDALTAATHYVQPKPDTEQAEPLAPAGGEYRPHADKNEAAMRAVLTALEAAQKQAQVAADLLRKIVEQ